MAIKNKDFIEIEFTGKIKETEKVFDTNDKEAAKAAGIFDEKAKYRPIIICVGEGDVVKGLDESFIGKEAGKSYTIEVPYDKGFGAKNPKLVKLMSLAKFQKENVQPMPGLQLDFGGTMGTIVTVSGGRVMVDFNHPLANRNLSYDVKIKRIVTDDKEKLEGFLDFYLGKKQEVGLKEGKAKITTKEELPEEVKKAIKEKAMARIAAIKEIEFAGEKKPEEKKEAAKPEEKPKEEEKK